MKKTRNVPFHALCIQSNGRWEFTVGTNNIETIVQCSCSGIHITLTASIMMKTMKYLPRDWCPGCFKLIIQKRLNLGKTSSRIDSFSSQLMLLPMHLKLNKSKEKRRKDEETFQGFWFIWSYTWKVCWSRKIIPGLKFYAFCKVILQICFKEKNSK